MKRHNAFVLLCLFLCVLTAAFSLPLTVFAAGTPAENAHLHFGSDGKFRILNFSDIQEDETLTPRVKSFLRQAVTDTQPDLIVLTGDNIYGGDTPGEETRTAIAQFMDIFESLGVPVAIVFGNHDDQDDALTKEQQMAFYNSYSVSISYDEGSSMDGCGTYNVPIYASAGSDRVAFNLWMFDTGSGYSSTYGYNYMRANQLNWYVSRSDALKAANGGTPVPSIAFQHIIVKEIFDALRQVSSGTAGAVEKNGKYYVLPATAKPGSVMNETPCPSKRGDEFSTVVSQGDVLAIVAGHDHTNSFVVPYQGVDLIATPSCGYDFYGSDALRGARILDLDRNTGTYTTQTILLTDYAPRVEYTVKEQSRYIKDVALCYFQEANNGSLAGAHEAARRCLYNAVDAENGNGIVVDADLNAGSTNDASSSNHVVVYLGYTLTDNPDEALRGLGVFYASSGSSANQYHNKTINGYNWVLCNYGNHEVAGTDGAVNLNRGTKGNPLYLYATYDASAGEPISEIRVVDTGASSRIQMSDYPGYSLVCPIVGVQTGEAYADLNITASGDYVYALTRTGVGASAHTAIDSGRIRSAFIRAQRLLAEPAARYTAESRNALVMARDWVQTNILDDLADGETSAYDQAALDGWADVFVRDYIEQLEPATYTVCFLDGDGTLLSVQIYGYGEMPYCEAPQKESDTFYTYTFTGWAPQLAAVTADAEYQAVYACTPVTYTVAFNANGGSCGVPSLSFTAVNGYGMLPDAQREGFRFLGWFTQSAGGTQVSRGDALTVYAAHTLYAHWEALRRPGDTDGDGNIDLADVTILIRYLASGWNVSVQTDEADVNADGKVNLKDAVLIRRALAGWDVTLL